MSIPIPPEYGFDGLSDSKEFKIYSAFLIRIKGADFPYEARIFHCQSIASIV